MKKLGPKVLQGALLTEGEGGSKAIYLVNAHMETTYF